MARAWSAATQPLIQSSELSAGGACELISCVHQLLAAESDVSNGGPNFWFPNTTQFHPSVYDFVDEDGDDGGNLSDISAAEQPSVQYGRYTP
jgi:hypothetical protein